GSRATGPRLIQICLDPARRMMDIDRLQAAPPEVLEPVWNPGGTQDDLASRSLDDRLPDKEPGPPFDDNEGLVVRMDMQARACAGDVRPVRQHRDGPSHGNSLHGSAPRAAGGRIELPRPRWRNVGLDTRGVEILACHRASLRARVRAGWHGGVEVSRSLPRAYPTMRMRLRRGSPCPHVRFRSRARDGRKARRRIDVPAVPHGGGASTAHPRPGRESRPRRPTG